MNRQVLAIASLALMVVALYFALDFAPTERTMGTIQRIFYFHLPQAISSYVSALLLGLASLMYLVTRDFKWDRVAYCTAELGVLYTTTTLLTGMIWARPVWNTWWAGDARTNLQLILGLLFVAYLMLRAYLPEREKRARLSTVFGFLAALDVPINYYATKWWETVHPRLSQEGGLDPQMRTALLVSFAAFGVLYAYLLAQRLALAKMEEETEEIEQAVAA
jgi:heme exporter protein C